MQQISGLLDHYGYITLFVGLLLELIALPTPGELLMSYCGFLVYQHNLNWPLSILVSSAGAISGITISYFLGRLLGDAFFRKHGSKIHMGPERMEKLSGWFLRYGNKLLFVAYFIPGIRHITGYFSGISGIPYRKFAIHAYTGALIWAGTFITLGRTLGPKWESFHGPSRRYLIYGGIAVAIVLLLYYLYKNHRTAIMDFAAKMMGTYKSLGRLKAFVTVTATVLTGLLILIAGMIQDYLANEFNKFDSIVSFIVRSIFIPRWFGFFNGILLITAPVALAVLVLFSLVWIRVRGGDRPLEIRFLLVVAIAGILLQECLAYAFHRLGPVAAFVIGGPRRSFPNEQTFLAIVVYGAAAYLVLRHIRISWARPIAIFLVAAVCFFTGVGEVLMRPDFPSDIAAGYVFGGAWLSLNVILLEVQRKFPVKRQA